MIEGEARRACVAVDEGVHEAHVEVRARRSRGRWDGRVVGLDEAALEARAGVAVEPLAFAAAA